MRETYRVPFAKPKSIEGSVAVAVAAAIGAWLAAHWFETPMATSGIVALGLTAAVAEALSPRGRDNVVVPAAVFAVATALS